MRQLIIIADTNDADYTFSIIKEEDNEKYFKMCLEALRSFGEAQSKIQDKVKIQFGHISGNWCNHEYCEHWGYIRPNELYKDILTEKEIEILEDGVIPFGEEGVHTVTSITLLMGDEERIL